MTDEDKELLRLAAKAYWHDDIDIFESIELSDYENGILYIDADNQDHNGNDVAMRWNPIEEEYDAFRLLVELELNKLDLGGIVMNYTTGEEYRADKFAAVRLGITRFAAEIGRKMP